MMMRIMMNNSNNKMKMMTKKKVLVRQFLAGITLMRLMQNTLNENFIKNE